MPITRIYFNSSASDSGAYILPLNPSSLDMNLGYENSTFRTLDGHQIAQYSYYDSRVNSMSWERLPVPFIGVSGISTMITTLNGYVGKSKYINLKSADPANPPLGYKKYRILDFQKTIEKGGKLRKNLTLLFSLDT